MGRKATDGVVNIVNAAVADVSAVPPTVEDAAAEINVHAQGVQGNLICEGLNTAKKGPLDHRCDPPVDEVPAVEPRCHEMGGTRSVTMGSSDTGATTKIVSFLDCPEFASLYHGLWATQQTLDTKAWLQTMCEVMVVRKRKSRMASLMTSSIDEKLRKRELEVTNTAVAVGPLKRSRPTQTMSSQVLN